MTEASTPDSIVIIADDLSGAVDTAAAWKAGHANDDCVVAPWIDSPHEPVEALWERIRSRCDPHLLSISTASRNLDPREAARRVRRAVHWASRAGVTRVKKVDSLLRGNVAEEIAEFISSSPAESFLFAPALPTHRRITLQGVQLLDGHEVGHTVAKDDGSPARSSHLEDFLPEGVPRRSLFVEQLRTGDIPEMGRKALDRPGVVVADALSTEDLVGLRRSAFDTGADLIGTSGIMSSLSPEPPLTLPSDRASVVVVTTSRRWEVEDQLDQLTSRVRDSTHVVIHPTHLPSVPELTKAMISGARASSVCIVSLSRSEAVDADPGRRADLGEAIVSTIADGVAGLLAEESGSGLSLVILGGDLAEGVATRCGVHSIEVLGQTADGGGFCRPMGEAMRGAGVWVVRSGAFGEAASLTRLFSWSRMNRRHL
jgi:uncharacterized protein YgbK (DUF1537 family)